MTKQLDLGGTFTLPNTSMTLNRMGYGAMQLAGQDGEKRVWGPPRDVPGAISSSARGHRLRREPHRYQRLLRPARNQSTHQAGTPSLP